MIQVYYNEIDPYAAQWLRNLIAAKLIPDGEVDTRSIEDVTPNELVGFSQCHFFTGIAGWPLALRLAGWPDDRPVWTGSCPCQPFSSSGKRAGFADERHLWPSWYHLIRERRPPVIFGEQVATVDATEWLDLVCNDLEASKYAIATADLPACSVGLPHQRSRLWWVADAIENGLYRAGIPEDQRQGVPLPARGSYPGARAPLPMPANAKDYRSVLLLPDGVPGELEQVSAFGNSLAPEVGAAFIRAYLDAAA